MLSPLDMNGAGGFGLTTTRQRKPVNKWVPDDHSEIANYSRNAGDTRDLVARVRLYHPSLLPIPLKDIGFGVVDTKLAP